MSNKLCPDYIYLSHVNDRQEDMGGLFDVGFTMFVDKNTKGHQTEAEKEQTHDDQHKPAVELLGVVILLFRNEKHPEKE